MKGFDKRTLELAKAIHHEIHDWVPFPETREEVGDRLGDALCGGLLGTLWAMHCMAPLEDDHDFEGIVECIRLTCIKILTRLREGEGMETLH